MVWPSALRCGLGRYSDNSNGFIALIVVFIMMERPEPTHTSQPITVREATVNKRSTES